MAGETNLQALLLIMRPVLDPEKYLFCSVSPSQEAQLRCLEPLALMRESEGLTVIVTQDQAKMLAADDLVGLDGSIQRRITLSVHSSLEAVGLTAAVSSALANAEIPANVVAAYYHDHVFVPDALALKALGVLEQLSSGSTSLSTQVSK